MRRAGLLFPFLALAGCVTSPTGLILEPEPAPLPGPDEAFVTYAWRCGMQPHRIEHVLVVDGPGRLSHVLVEEDVGQPAVDDPALYERPLALANGSGALDLAAFRAPVVTHEEERGLAALELRNLRIAVARADPARLAPEYPQDGTVVDGCSGGLAAWHEGAHRVVRAIGDGGPLRFDLLRAGVLRLHGFDDVV